MLNQAMSSAPLWLVAIPFFLALALMAQFGRWARGRVDRGSDDSDTDGSLLSASLALLGLLIAFTFSLAVSRYDTRRAMIVAEGNAIGTAWLRATLAPGPEGAALRDALKGYADLRLRVPASTDLPALNAATSRSQEQLWRRLQGAIGGMQPPIAATLVTATTEMFDAASSRKAEGEARIPGRVLRMVSLFALLCAGIVGYVLGRDVVRRHLVVTAILFLLLTMAMTLILDLDRPWSGGVVLSQQPIIDARAAME